MLRQWKIKEESVEPSVVIDAVKIIYPAISENELLNTKFVHTLKYLSYPACDQLLTALETVKDKSTFLTTWVQFLEKLIAIDKERMLELNEIFLKRYPWDCLNQPQFFSLIETLWQPEMKNLWEWFIHYVEEKFLVAIDSTILQDHFKLFTQFIDVNIKYKTIPHLSKPLAQNALSFHLQGKNYLARCVDVLEKSSNKVAQAKLLHALPDEVIINQAFLQKIPFVCKEMVYHNRITLPKLTELSELYDYANYKASALAYLAETSAIPFEQCLNFFTELDHIKLTHLDQNEKLMLAKIFTTYAGRNVNTASSLAFIYWAEQLKRSLGESYFTALFELPTQVEDLNHYTTVCQLLIDLVDEADIEVIFTHHQGNLSDLITLLQIKKSEFLIKKYPEKSLDNVINDFQKQSEFVKFPLSLEEIAQLKKDYSVIQSFSFSLSTMSLNQLVEDAKRCAEASNKEQNTPSQLKLIAIIRELIRRVFKLYPYNTQILSLLSLINAPKDCKGRIGQIRTGEGKSMIVAMLAAFFGLQGKAVDIITSSRYLASRDQIKYKAFFDILGITSSHICYDYPKQKDFDGQIIYSTNYDAEFSILRDLFYQRELRYTTFNDQLSRRPFDVAIVDEVDNLFIDAALNSARLAIAASKLTAWIYEPILKFVQTCGERPKGNLAPFKQFQLLLQVQQLRDVLEKYQDGKYKEQVASFSDEQLLIWINAAYRAQFKLRIEQDYIIKPSKKMTEEGEVNVMKVMIVDFKNTGRISTNNRFSYGVHEFIEVKHGLPPKDESATLAAISHPAFFSYYKFIFGLTGTIGEFVEREEIKKIYQVDTFDVPPHFPSQRAKTEAKCFATQNEYFTAILLNMMNAHDKGQPSLILFSSIAETLAFASFLKSKNIRHQLLNETQAEDEDYIIDRAGLPGMFTIATNIAGRGADIMLTPESKQAGGLNLVLAFYPASLRVEDQGEGRAGRQGQPGSCSMILHSEDEQIKKLIKDKNERLALCDDDHFIDKLQKLRSEQIVLHSNERMMQSEKEIIHFDVLKQFAEILTAFTKFLANISLESIAVACARIVEPANDLPILLLNPMLQILQNRAQHLFEQQKNGVAIDWQTSFLQSTVESYITHIQQKWAQFFSSWGRKSAGTVSVNYQKDLHTQFVIFIEQQMRQDLENPFAGFVLFLSQLLKTDLRTDLLSEIKANESRVFANWFAQLRAAESGVNVSKIGMFAIDAKSASLVADLNQVSAQQLAIVH